MNGPTIRSEAPALPRELVLASAGTGKTFRISSRIIGLLAAGEAPDAIFASTFTRAAAGEILDRVLQRLARAALDSQAAAELSAHASLDDGPHRPFTPEDWLRLLARVTRDLHRLNISTLDAFFVRTASTFADEIGLPPGWGIADRAVADGVLAEALDDLLARSDTDELVELVRGLDGREVKRSVHEALKRRATDILAVHDSIDPAATDAWNAFDALDSRPPADLYAWRQRLATAFRAIDPPLTRAGTPRQRWVKALDGAADGIEVANWAAVLKGKLFENVLLGVPLFDTFEIPRAVLDLIEETCELARCDLARIYALRSAAMAHLSERLADAMARARRNAGAYEFHDITRLVGGTDPLCQRPDLHYRLDARVQHILLDEFQDTSLAQWEAIEPLVDELLSGYEGERSAVVVADPKQSIYGWRGGEPLLVRHLSDRYHLAQDELSRSWRSSDVVLESVNRIFTSIAENAVFDRQTMGHMVAREWVKAFAPHTAAKTLPGHVRLVVGPEDEGRSEDRPRLCRRAAELVAELHRSAPGRTIGVLTRRNATVARLMLELRELGIEASEEGGNPLTDSAAVSAVVALLRMADHPGDTLARYHVAKSPLGAVVGYTDHRDGAAARRVAERIRRRLIEQGYGRTLAELSRDLAPACSRRDRRRLSQLAELGFRYDPGATLRPSDFLPVLEAERVEDSTSADVRVMTIHRSKGLEFDIVVLPELDAPLHRTTPELFTYRPRVAGRVTRVFPYVKEVERSLFTDIPELGMAADQVAAARWRDGLSGLYVALTRARHAVHMLVKPDAIKDSGKVGGSTACTGARLVRNVLAPDREARPGAVLYEAGDPNWDRELTAGTGVPRGRGSELQGTVERVALRPSTGRKTLGQVAPSGLAGGTSVDLRWLLGLDRSGAQRGTLVHAWLQRVGWLEDGVPSDAELLEIAGRTEPSLPAGTVARLLANFREWMGSSGIGVCLRRDSYPAGARVECEVPFLHRTGDRLVEGVIDRLVLVEEEGKVVGAEILDYKTDALDAGDGDAVAAKVAHYRPQMEAYRAAVASWYRVPQERIAARLVFLEGAVVVEV